ncbi:TPA: DUF961 family protein [Streptococcus agalactiae]|nr:DUF961 family protein [Streptococcus agalactiae]HEN4303140.1 DUF961 family protein [Streptococcus agalactiae]
MSIKFGSFEDIKSFDKEKTVGKLTFLEAVPRYRFEETVDGETGEMKSMPTDDIEEYDVLCYSTVAKGNIIITVPADAKGVEVDSDKGYRKPISFNNLTGRLWTRREKRMSNNREITVHTFGTKFRASDFTVDLGIQNQPKQELKGENK